MEPSIFGFIWKYSKRQQLVILALSVALLPLNYYSYDIPKQIVNQALGSDDNPTFFGYSMDRIDLLMILCGLFLGVVLISGALKYVVNVYAGVVAERMLRRLRYQLYSTLLRFPLPHLRRVSQGELVQMINAETEALGGFVGEAVSTPGLQAGTLLTSLFFMFVQDWKLGLAAVALYPLQIWLIPKLQRQVNLLGKERVRQVRRNAEKISEVAMGARDIRANDATVYERVPLQRAARHGVLDPLRHLQEEVPDQVHQQLHLAAGPVLLLFHRWLPGAAGADDHRRVDGGGRRAKGHHLAVARAADLLPVALRREDQVRAGGLPVRRAGPQGRAARSSASPTRSRG